MTGVVRRSGFVALAGRPNVGKSTLVNRLVGEHVAAVSERPQTTRRRTLGVATVDETQIVLADLPGFQKPFDRLTERMQRAVDEALADVDLVLLLLDAGTPVGPGDRFIAARVMRPASPPCIVVVNKVDRASPATIAERIAEAVQLGEFLALHPISARTGDGVAALLDDVVAALPTGPAYFPAGVTSDQTAEQRIAERIREAALLEDVVAALPAGPAYFPVGVTSDQTAEQRIAERIREAALHLTRDEVPHALAVVVEEIEPGGRGVPVVRATLICETESQKAILVGRGGSMIRRIGSDARPAVEQVTGRHSFLALSVKVRPRWRRDEGALDRLGV